MKKKELNKEPNKRRKNETNKKKKMKKKILKKKKIWKKNEKKRKENWAIYKKVIFTPKTWKWPKFAKREFSLKKGLGSTYTP